MPGSVSATLSEYAVQQRLRPPDSSDLSTGIGRCQAQARTLVIAAYAISEGCRVELASEPGRALSESEAAAAVLAGHPLVVVE